MLVDESHRADLTKFVLAITPDAISAWDWDVNNPGEKAIFAKEVVDLAEALMLEISKRNAP